MATAIEGGDVLTLLFVQDLETECVKPQPSEKLAQIGLQLLKYVSSHRGLTYVYLNYLQLIILNVTTYSQ